MISKRRQMLHISTSCSGSLVRLGVQCIRIASGGVHGRPEASANSMDSSSIYALTCACETHRMARLVRNAKSQQLRLFIGSFLLCTKAMHANQRSKNIIWEFQILPTFGTVPVSRRLNPSIFYLAPHKTCNLACCLRATASCSSYEGQIDH